LCFCALSTNRKRFADVLRHESRESDVIRRLGGDEFVVLLTEANGDPDFKVVQRLHVALAQRNVQGKRGYEIRFSVGHTEYDAQRHASIADLLASSDSRMVAHKPSLKSASRNARF
jgi:diguanylate cyclase (GGDEF)-like protein